MRKLLRISVLLVLAFSLALADLKANGIIEFGSSITVKEATYNDLAPKGLKEQSEYKYKIYEAIPTEVVEGITGVSYLEDGPVAIKDLAYLKLTYWGFDAKTHLGEIIVHKELAKEVAEIFSEIYAAKFPIAKMRLIDEYQADDDLSMADNNTSGLCMRKVRGTDSYSKHSFGVAIDINPVQNPYLWQGTVLPQAGQVYIDRQNLREGMLVKGDAVYEAFTNRGWTWGGEWKTLKDYQHFQKNN